MTQLAERFERYVSEFDAFQREAAFGSETERTEAFRRFVDRGFPTTREEEWRFTNVAPIAAMAFVRAPRASHEEGEASTIHRHVQPYLFDGVPLVLFVNGRLYACDPGIPAGVTLGGAVSALSMARKHAAANPFVDLNTAFFEEIAVIDVAPGAVVETPIHVLHFSNASGQPALVSPRLLLRAGERSQVTIIESYAGSGAAPVLTNATSDFVLAPGAVVHHVKVQREAATTFHVASMFADLGRASTLHSIAVTFGARIARNDIVAELAGEGAECTLNGLYLADGDALVDTHTIIDHAQPHCPSHEVYKGILAGRSRAVFNGKIIVRPDAQKTNAKQTNKALLLTDDAQINTKPQLEIFADDVKCTHGAAIGQLDDEAMFYLRARGVGEVDARSMLIHAFASEILDGIGPEAVRGRVQVVMEEKLAIAHEELS